MKKVWYGKHGKVERCNACAPRLRVSVSHVPVGPASERMETFNTQRDTLRAVEYMYKTGQCTGEQAARWSRDAGYLSDKNTPVPERETGPPVTIDQQVAERETEGVIKHLWSEAQYERNVLKREPENDVQALNYEMVDRWEGKT